MVRSIGSTGSTSGSKRRPPAGKVELAARRVLRDIATDSDHAAADLLNAVAERLARDIDQAPDARERVAASKELREVLRDLDTAVLPSVPARVDGPVEGGADDDDVFDIGTELPGMPPVVGDSEAG